MKAPKIPQGVVTHLIERRNVIWFHQGELALFHQWVIYASNIDAQMDHQIRQIEEASLTFVKML